MQLYTSILQLVFLDPKEGQTVWSTYTSAHISIFILKKILIFIFIFLFFKNNDCKFQSDLFMFHFLFEKGWLTSFSLTDYLFICFEREGDFLFVSL